MRLLVCVDGAGAAGTASVPLWGKALLLVGGSVMGVSVVTSMLHRVDH